MKQHVMLDLETMGTSPNSAITAIGAVSFDIANLEVIDGFYVNVSLADCLRAGMEVDGGTVMWWLQQSEHARKRLADPAPVSLTSALYLFTRWCKERSETEESGLPVWGNGSDFDCVLLRNAYARLGMEPPWRYHQARCYRTLKNLLPQARELEPPRDANKHHDALADAEWQAQHLFNMVAFIRDDVPSFMQEDK